MLTLRTKLCAIREPKRATESPHPERTAWVLSCQLGPTCLKHWCWDPKPDGGPKASWEKCQWDPERHQAVSEDLQEGHVTGKGRQQTPGYRGRTVRNADADAGRTGERATPQSGKAGQGIFRESVWRAICYLLTVRIKCEKRGMASEVLKQKKARSCKRKLFLISNLSSWQNTLKLWIVKTLSHSCVTETGKQRKAVDSAWYTYNIYL